MQATQDFLKMFVALFVMINPISSAPMFLALTESHPEARPKVATTAVTTSVVILVLSAFFGRFTLQLFGITVDSFRVIGGILFLLMALDMLNASPSRTRQTPEEQSEATKRGGFAVVPLGVPMLTGPGSISWVLIAMTNAETWIGKSLVLLVIFACGALTFVTLRLASPLGKVLGTSGQNILTRLMGLIVGAIAIEYMVAGLKAMIPALR